MHGKSLFEMGISKHQIPNQCEGRIKGRKGEREKERKGERENAVVCCVVRGCVRIMTAVLPAAALVLEFPSFEFVERVRRYDVRVVGAGCRTALPFQVEGNGEQRTLHKRKKIPFYVWVAAADRAGHSPSTTLYFSLCIFASIPSQIVQRCRAKSHGAWSRRRVDRPARYSSCEPEQPSPSRLAGSCNKCLSRRTARRYRMLAAGSDSLNASAISAFESCS